MFSVLVVGLAVLLRVILKEYAEIRKVVLQTKLAKKTIVDKVV